MPRTTDQSVFRANLGLFLDRPALSIPTRGLKAGNNFRIRDGELSNLNMGWELFGSFNALNGPVLLIDQFFFRSGGQKLIFGTTKDLYEYVEASGLVLLLTPRYETGTANPTNGSAVVTGGTAWDTNLKVGDQMFFGSTGQRDPDATGNGGWYTILTVDSATQVTLTANYTGTGGAQAYTARKLFSGDSFDIWDAETFFDAQPEDKDLWFATNGVDDIVEWDGSATQVTLTALTFKCRSLRKYKNMLLYGYIIEDTGEVKPTSFKNSDAGSPKVLAGGVAGEFIVSDQVDPILAIFLLGDDAVFYGERNITLAQFVGSDLGFIFRTAVSGVGATTARSIADFGDYHEFLGPDSQYAFDGVALRVVGSQVWREILRIKSPDRLSLAFNHFDEENGDLIWSIPLTTDVLSGSEVSAKEAYVEHYLEETGSEQGTEDITPFSHRDFPFTASGFFERQATLTWDQISTTWAAQNYRWNDQFFEAAFPFSLVGDEQGRIFTLNTSALANGAGMTSYARFGRRSISDGRARNLLKRVVPFTSDFPGAAYGLTVTVYGSDRPSGQATMLSSSTFDITGTSPAISVAVYRRMRYMEVEFGTPGPNQPWEMQGYDVDVTRGGRRHG